MDSAWLLDPVWRKVDGDKRYAFLGGQPVGEPLGGLLFGPNLLSDDVDAGVALLRAYIRTVNTYFPGDYKKNAPFVSQLAKLLKTRRQTMLKSDPVTPDGLGDPQGHDRPATEGVPRRRASPRAKPLPEEKAGRPRAVRGGGGPQALTVPTA